jgi:hypothetical protein
MRKTHLERNRERIAKVREENVARAARKARGKQAKPQTPPPVQQPSEGLMRIGFREHGAGDSLHFTKHIIYRGQALNLTQEQTSEFLELGYNIWKAFGREPTSGEYDTLLHMVTEQS